MSLKHGDGNAVIMAVAVVSGNDEGQWRAYNAYNNKYNLAYTLCY